jgi:antitoxin MazE
MKIPIVKVGNSRGIRFPKAVIEQCQLGPEVNLEVKNQKVIISPSVSPRLGWDKAFQKMAKNGDEGIEGEDFSNDWDEQEWEWK